MNRILQRLTHWSDRLSRFLSPQPAILNPTLLARVYPHLIIRVSRSLDPGKANFLFAQVYRPKHREQKPTFRLFGTPEKNKRHVLLETAHYALTARTQVLCEVLRWLDKTLGPVQ